jgi:hypothetical protein
MTKAKLSIHQAAAALAKRLHAPQGAITSMVDIDERKGEVIRILIAPEHWHAFQGSIPDSFMGYPVVLAPRPLVHVFTGRT